LKGRRRRRKKVDSPIGEQAKGDSYARAGDEEGLTFPLVSSLEACGQEMK